MMVMVFNEKLNGWGLYGGLGYGLLIRGGGVVDLGRRRNI